MSNQEKECPLCISKLSEIENDFYPCPCGFQICSFCFQRIMDDPSMRKCPYCRRPYDADAIDRKGPQFKPVQNSSHTVTTYYISRKIVQVVGLPKQIRNTGILRQDKFFGQYGPIQKISVDHQKAPSSKTIISNTGESVFIKFVNPSDAQSCIFVLDGFTLNYDGKSYPIQASLAVVEQCPSLLNGSVCNKRICLKRHRQPKKTDEIISVSEIDSKDPNIKTKYNLPRPANYDLFPKRTKIFTILPPLRLAPPFKFPFIHTELYAQSRNPYELFMSLDKIPPAILPGNPSETVPLAYTLNLEQ